MWRLIIIATVLGVTRASLSSNFYRYAGSNNAMDRNHFTDFWLVEMDKDHDHRLSSSEFIQGWRHEHYSESTHALLFFVELDMDHDQFIDSNDLNKLFLLFDFNEDGFVGKDEFYASWDSFFADIINNHHSNQVNQND